MPYTKTMIILANSRKLNGRCVAGKELDKGKVGPWIRPISIRPTGELSDRDRRYSDGKDPKLFDLVHVNFLEEKAHPHQNENHMIDDNIYWHRLGVASSNQVKACIDPIKGELWNNKSSSYNGRHDRVAEKEAGGAGSLKFIEVGDLTIHVQVEGAAFGNGRKKVRAEFSAAGHNYLLAVTDPGTESKYLGRDEGVYDIGRVLLCISLGEPYQGFVYKLVAAMTPL